MREMADPTPGIWDAVKEYWGPIAFFIGVVGAYIAGRERVRFRLDEIETDVQGLNRKIERLEAEGRSDRLVLTEIKTTLATVVTSLAEIRADLKQKADK